MGKNRIFGIPPPNGIQQRSQQQQTAIVIIPIIITTNFLMCTEHEIAIALPKKKREASGEARTQCMYNRTTEMKKKHK